MEIVPVWGCEAAPSGCIVLCRGRTVLDGGLVDLVSQEKSAAGYRCFFQTGAWTGGGCPGRDNLPVWCENSEKRRAVSGEAGVVSGRKEKQVNTCVKNRKDGSVSYFFTKEKGIRLWVADAAAGSRFYTLGKTTDGGWRKYDPDDRASHGDCADRETAGISVIAS